VKRHAAFAHPRRFASRHDQRAARKNHANRFGDDARQIDEDVDAIAMLEDVHRRSALPLPLARAVFQQLEEPADRFVFRMLTPFEGDSRHRHAL
jgi:hypothetical protein